MISDIFSHSQDISGPENLRYVCILWNASRKLGAKKNLPHALYFVNCSVHGIGAGETGDIGIFLPENLRMLSSFIKHFLNCSFNVLQSEGFK